MNRMYHRIPPQNIEAEKAILASILKDSDCLDQISDMIKPSDFVDPRNRNIFYAMEALVKDTNTIDLLTLSNYLKNNRYLSNQLYQYLVNLNRDNPNIAHIKYYAKIVKNKSLLRKTIRIGQKLENDAYNQKNKPDTVLRNAESNILKVDESNKSSGLKPINKLIVPATKHIDDLRKHHKEITGTPTGFSSIDHITTGLHSGEFIVIAARPAMGKTTIAMNIAQHVATNSDKAVAVFSLEMGSESLIDRMICAGGNIDHAHLRTGFLTKDEAKRLVFPLTDLSNSNLYIDDTPGINVASILARSRRLVKQGVHLGLIVVDYLQLVEGDASNGRQQEVAGISRALKKLAKELNVPVIALSQLSRSVEQREDKRPVLSDIRESGAIEQDADIVAFLYRKDYYEQHKNKQLKPSQIAKNNKIKEENGDPSLTEFIIAKNREGARGSLKLMFLKSYNKFASLTQRQLDKLEASAKK